jgi:large subunit ribosomal protein L2
MAVKSFKSTTPSRRTMTVSDFADITSKKPAVKSLIEKKAKGGGRNNQGRVTVRWIGGGPQTKI